VQGGQRRTSEGYEGRACSCGRERIPAQVLSQGPPRQNKAVTGQARGRHMPDITRELRWPYPYQQDQRLPNHELITWASIPDAEDSALCDELRGIQRCQGPCYSTCDFGSTHRTDWVHYWAVISIVVHICA
jgi:hypothetical protein